MDVMHVIDIVYHNCRVSIAISMKLIFWTSMQLFQQVDED